MNLSRRMIRQMCLNHPILSDDAGARPATLTCSLLGVKLFGCLFVIEMLEFSFGVACGANCFLYVTPQMICSRHSWSCFIEMFEFSVGVACGAKKCL